MDNVQKKNKVLILGLGGAGGRVVQTLSTLPEAADLALCVFDTDRSALDRLTLLDENCKVLCDEQWLQGQGTGGDTMKGQRALSRESSKLQSLISQTSLLIVIGGLGGGTATGGAGVISRLSRTMSVSAVMLFELPFTFEGHVRCKTADDGLRSLLTLSDTVLGIHNDLLFSVLPAETSFVDAFKLADLELARAALGVINVLLPDNLLTADIGDLAGVLRNRKSHTAIGVGIGAEDSVAESCTAALANLADSPFLGGVGKIKEADAVIINLTGGEALTLSEAKRTLEHANTMPGMAAQILIGANIKPELGTHVHLTAIAVKYDDRDPVAENIPETAKTSARGRKVRRKTAEQPVQQTLPLTIATSGIFEGKTGTVIDGINLDIPTFVRCQIPVDTGE